MVPLDINDIRNLVQDILGYEISDVNSNFFDLGFGSIMLPLLKNEILNNYGLDVPFNWFYNETSTTYTLYEYIRNKMLNSSVEENIKSTLDNNSGIAESNQSNTSEDIRHVMVEQLHAMSQLINNQLDFIKMIQGKSSIKSTHSNIKTSSFLDFSLEEPFIPFQKIETEDKSSRSTKVDNEAIRNFYNEYTLKTSKSKITVQKYRSCLANNRNVAGFKPSLKELIYPIIVKSADGSRIIDIDNNEYIDIAMGFGVYLFGHKVDFISNAIKKVLDIGLPIGPMNETSGKVAELICEMTGVERVAFYNSGTEAVMVAIRLARAATGKSKIVLFAGSYHGTFDGVLARAKNNKSGSEIVPIAPGITQSLINDVIVLEYGVNKSLKFIEENTNDIAAVLVEPIQSRRLDLQPKEFLSKLRIITEQNGVALIFDEVITGFRVHPGGLQALFEVQADLVTYGKVIGGGLPIGVVAGKSSFMDSIDGGVWNYGDQSFPMSDGKRTFVAGTFCHHPLAMSASHAVLTYMKEIGYDLQMKLNLRTSMLVERLNDYFAQIDAPVKVISFCSIFKFVIEKKLELFFYFLLKNGVYTWEGRTCFISLAHTDSDIENIITAVKQSILDMYNCGILELDLDKDYSIEEGNAKVLPNIIAFDDLYYKDCFFNALFPIISHFNKNIIDFYTNEIIAYKVFSGQLFDFGIEYISNLTTFQRLEYMGIFTVQREYSSDVITDIICDINANRPLIILVDAFYESNRKDTFNREHLSHSLVVYGYDKNKEVLYVLEHDKADSLKFKATAINFKEMINSYEGYISNFKGVYGKASLFSFYLIDKGELIHNDKGKYIQTKFNNRNLILERIASLKSFVEEFDKININNIGRILPILNEIVNAKKIEKFQIESLFQSDCCFITILDSIIDDISIVRAILSKAQITQSIESSTKNKLYNKMMNIYSKEEEFLKLVCNQAISQQ